MAARPHRAAEYKSTRRKQRAKENRCNAPPGRSEVLWVNIADKEAPHYVCNDHTFLHLRFAYNEELGGDVLWIQTHKIDMDDDSVTAGLKAIRDILVECADRDVHFCSMYDLRTYKLPGVSGGYARAKQLIGWCQTLATPPRAHRVLRPLPGSRATLVAPRPY